MQDRDFGRKYHEEANRLGGSDSKQWSSYKTSDQLPGFDKFHHSQRSVYHQPNHSKKIKDITNER